MAYEVKPWKEPNCELSLRVDSLSDRETFSREINEKYGEGGGLNANYRTVEAIAIIANLLGKGPYRMVYGKDFVFKTGSSDSIIFDFRDKKTQLNAQRCLEMARRHD